MRVTIGANDSLKGHKLLLLLPAPPSPTTIDNIKQEFPDLAVTTYIKPWANSDAHDGQVPDSEWQDVTIMATGSALPERARAPKLQYVQLLSAGANHVLQNPLFKDPGVALCTANGVHG
jgi:hypothetical protein